MLPAVMLGIAMSVLAAACALVDPEPPGTQPVPLTVNNETGAPVDVRITTLTGDVAGSAMPTTVPPGVNRLPVTINVPVSAEWILELGDTHIPGAELDDYSARGCVIGVDLLDDGGYAFGCANDL